MSLIILLTTNTRWEAELMEQILVAHVGVKSYLGSVTPGALQVHSR